MRAQGITIDLNCNSFGNSNLVSNTLLARKNSLALIFVVLTAPPLVTLAEEMVFKRITIIGPPILNVFCRIRIGRNDDKNDTRGLLNQDFVDVAPPYSLLYKSLGCV
jgi:hypothetical protein